MSKNTVSKRTYQVNLSGQHFGRLTVICQAQSRRDHGNAMRRFWLCRCKCGKVKTVAHGALISRHTTSCGCSRIRHGNTQSRLYRIWAGMKYRCSTNHSPLYENYKSRGIIVCKRWSHSFEAFLSDMGKPPTAFHSIDRVDNNRGYYPDNCRWSTMVEQSNNTRRNRMLTLNGQRHTISQWSKITGICYSTLLKRLHSGWTVNSTLCSPIQKCKRHKHY